PRWPIISGRRLGPNTKRTMTRTTTNSPMPMPNMGGDHRSASHQPQHLVVLRRDRRRQDTAPSTEPSTPLTARRLLQRRQTLLPRSSCRGRGRPQALVGVGRASSMGGQMLYMIVEHFRDGDPLPVYRRLRDEGRLAPQGLRYVASWVTDDFRRCFQIMECEARALLAQ